MMTMTMIDPPVAANDDLPIPAIPSRQAGATLVEILLFLLIAAIIAIAVFAIFENGWSNTKVQTEGQYDQAIAAATKQMYGTANNYGTADLTATLISTKAAPAPTIVGAALVNEWGGNITVTGANASFTITESNVPQKECIQLSQLAINPTALAVNGTSQTLPYTATAAIAACTSTTANTITWTLN